MPELNELRGQINRIDTELRPLLEQRMDCAGQIADAKMQTAAQTGEKPVIFAGAREAEILAALPVSGARGSMIGGESDLVVSGAGGLKVTLMKASLVRGPLQWGTTTLRAGELGFTAHRSFAGGVPGPVFSVEMA